ncbi:MAG: dihydrodipicolinate synthase family protein [Tenericutes bacterium]|nr:dihydrodipicolinate synthase family protein [Mycoplasmatota bacterium]
MAKKDIIVALVTPFDEKGNINEKVLSELIEYNISQGATGFFVGGSSGEGPLLTSNERKNLFKLSKTYSKNTMMIANVSALHTDEAIDLAKYANYLGYDFVSSTAPYFYIHDVKDVAQYFIDIIEESGSKMIIYNFPKLSKFTFDLENKYIINLLRHPGMYGIKHTNYDLYELERFSRVNKNLKIYNGYDEIYLSTLSLDVDGAIGSTFNFLSKYFVIISDHYINGRYEEALHIQNNMNAIMDVLIEVGLISGIKYALSLYGFDCGIPKRPFRELSDDDKKKIDLVLEEYLKE